MGVLGNVVNFVGKHVVNPIVKGLGIGSNLKDAWREVTGQNAAAENNQLQLDFARENLGAQIAMNRENNAFNASQAERMFNLENAYNSPVEQMKRLQAAGLNPALMYGAGGASATGMSSGSPASSSGSGISPVMPNTQPIPSSGGFFIDLVRTATQGIKDLAQAENVGVDTEYLRNTLESRIKNADIQAKLQEIVLGYKPREQKAIVEGLEKSLSKIDEEIVNLKKAGKKLDADTLVSEVTRDSIRDENARNELIFPLVKYAKLKEGELLAAQEKTEDALRPHRVNTEKSKANANNAAAEESRSSAKKIDSERKTIDDLRADTVESLKQDIQNKKFNRAAHKVKAILDAQGVGKAPLTAIYNGIVNWSNHHGSSETIEDLLEDALNDEGYFE